VINFVCVLPTETLFFKTAFEPEAERRKALATSASRFALLRQAAEPISSDKWILMTRAHFAEALVAVAMHLNLADQVRCASLIWFSPFP
jgi:hypothetical protein